MIYARAAAVQGVGYGPAQMALQGLLPVEQPVQPATGGGWGWWPAPRKRRHHDDDDDAPAVAPEAPAEEHTPGPQHARQRIQHAPEPVGPSAAQQLDAIAARSQAVREAIARAALADRIAHERLEAARRRRRTALLLLMH